MSFHHNAICRYLLARSHNYYLIYHERFSRYFGLGAISYYSCSLRSEIEEFSNGGRAALFDFFFHIFSKEDKCNDDGRDIKIDILFLYRENAGKENDKCAVKISRRCAECDEEVHIGYSLFNRLISTDEKSLSAKNHDRCCDNK